MSKKWSEVNNTGIMFEGLISYCAVYYFLGSVLRVFDGWSTWEIAAIPLYWVVGWMLATTVTWLWRKRRDREG